MECGAKQAPADSTTPANNVRDANGPGASQTPAADFLNKDELLVLKELNWARTKPAEVMALLEKRRACYTGRELRGSPGAAPITTVEGVKGLEEAIARLKTVAGYHTPMGELQAQPGLSLAARGHATWQGPLGEVGSAGHTKLKGASVYTKSTPAQRCEEYGKFAACCEAIDYAHAQPLEIVLSLIVDDGVRERTHFWQLFKRELTDVGISLGPHSYYQRMCVFDFAQAWQQGPQTQNRVIGFTKLVLSSDASTHPGHTRGAGDQLAARIQAVIRAKMARRFVAKLRVKQQLNRTRVEAGFAVDDSLHAFGSKSYSKEPPPSIAPKGAIRMTVWSKDGQWMVKALRGKRVASGAGKDTSIRTRLFRHGSQLHEAVGSACKGQAKTGAGCDVEYGHLIAYKIDKSVDPDGVDSVTHYVEVSVVSAYSHSDVIGSVVIGLNTVNPMPHLSGEDDIDKAGEWYALEDSEKILKTHSVGGAGGVGGRADQRDERSLLYSLTEPEINALKAQTKMKAQKKEYGEKDIKVRGITRFTYKHPRGWVYWYVNKNDVYTIHETLTFDMTNLRIEGLPITFPPQNVVVTDVRPGNDAWVMVTSVNRNISYRFSAKASVRFTEAAADKEEQKVATDRLSLASRDSNNDYQTTQVTRTLIEERDKDGKVTTREEVSQPSIILGKDFYLKTGGEMKEKDKVKEKTKTSMNVSLKNPMNLFTSVKKEKDTSAKKDTASSKKEVRQKRASTDVRADKALTTNPMRRGHSDSTVSDAASNEGSIMEMSALKGSGNSTSLPAGHAVYRCDYCSTLLMWEIAKGNQVGCYSCFKAVSASL
jgi:hypothetical protein